MDSFFVAFNAVVPFFIYFAFGYGIRMTGLVDKPFLVRLNQMIFKVFFPVMMFNNIYHADLKTAFQPDLILFTVSSTFPETLVRISSAFSFAFFRSRDT